jgi:hypothetical protein
VGGPGDGKVVGQPDRDAYQVGQWREPAQLSEGGTPDGEDPRLARPDVGAPDEPFDLGGKPGLAQAGLPGDDQHPRLAPVDDLGEPAGDPGQLGLPPDERRLVSESGAGTRCVEQAQQFVCLDRLPLALEPQRPQVAPRRQMAGRDGGALARIYRADRGRVGQPGGGVHGVADDRVFQPRLHAGHHHAGVEPDPQSERRPAAPFVVEHPAHRALHRQRRADRPFGVVLVGDRGPEDRHDPVAGQLVDVPAEGLDRPGQGRHHPVGDRADPFRIKILSPGGEVGQVAEQDSDDPAFGRGQGGGGRQCGAAVVTEPGARHRDRPAYRTRHGVSQRTLGGEDSR